MTGENRQPTPGPGPRPAPPAELTLVMCPPSDFQKPPISLAYLSTFMKSQGYRVEVVDANAIVHEALSTSPFYHIWEKQIVNAPSAEDQAKELLRLVPRIFELCADRIVATGAPVVGFSTHMRNVLVAERLSALVRARKPDVRVIYGGPEVAVRQIAGTLGQLTADAYVMGEGEYTLLELMETFRRTGELRPMPGVVLPGQDPATFTMRPHIRDLDSLPFPTYEEFLEHPYAAFNATAGRELLPFLFSRGCIGNCAFCVDRMISGKYRARSAEHAVAEIKWHMARYGTRRFAFNDLACNGSPRALERFADLVIAENLDIRWTSFAMIRRGCSEEHFRKLRRSGCYSLMFGVESASDKVLKGMNKYYDGALAEEVIRACHRAGIRTAINFIVGFPGEGTEEHRQSLDFLRRNREYVDMVSTASVCSLTPGSRLYAAREEYGVEPDPLLLSWRTADGNDLSERIRRLDELLGVVEELGLPPVPVITRESDLARPEPPVLRIAETRMFNAVGQECAHFHPGEALTIRVRFEVLRPVTSPLIRVQFFNDENPTGQNVLVFGTHNERFGLRLGDLVPGEAEVCLLVYRLNLLPGTYRLSIGIWPDENAQHVLDARFNAQEFYILGDPDPVGAKALIPVQWAVQPRDVPPVAVGRVGPIRLSGHDGVERVTFSPHESLFVRAECDVEGDGADLVARIVTARFPAAHFAFPQRLAAGGHAIELSCRPLVLLGGDYELLLSLLDPATGEELAVARRAFSVVSAPPDGGGLVFAPCAWRFVKLPAPFP